MLSGNFKEENLLEAINNVRNNSNEYRSLFSKCSVFLENLSNDSIETNVLKGIGYASNAVGKFIGSIPKIKGGQVDIFLQEAGDKINTNASGLTKDIIESFSQVSNPNTIVFENKMEEMIQIFDKTSEVCFDKEKIFYLIAS